MNEWQKKGARKMGKKMPAIRMVNRNTETRCNETNSRHKKKKRQRNERIFLKINFALRRQRRWLFQHFVCCSFVCRCVQIFAFSVECNDGMSVILIIVEKKALLKLTLEKCKRIDCIESKKQRKKSSTFFEMVKRHYDLCLCMLSDANFANLFSSSHSRLVVDWKI